MSYLCACSPQGDSSPDSQVSFKAVQAIFDRHGCATSTCHGGSTPEANLSLEAPLAHISLVNQPCANPAAANSEMWLVTPGEPDMSYLYLKLALSSADMELGSPMPPVGEPLSISELEVIRLWIEQGASNQ